MNETLRPSTLGEILDRTAQLYRRNFWLFIGTAALPLAFIVALAIPAGLAFAAPAIMGTGSWPTTPFAIIALIVLGLVFAPAYLAAYVFSYAGVTQATVSICNGERPTFRGTLASVKPRFWTYLWYMILQGFFAGVVPAFAAAIVIIPGFFLMTRSSIDLPVRFGLGFLLALAGVATIFAVVWLTLSFTMGIAVCVAEKKSAWESLLRSWHLSPGARGRIFVTFLLVWALAIAISLALAVPMFLIIALMPGSGGGALGSQPLFLIAEILRVILDFASQVLLTPILFIAAVLFYYDQRIRKEGYDIEWMMQQAGLVQPPAAPPLAGIPWAFAPPAPPDPVPPVSPPPDTVKE